MMNYEKRKGPMSAVENNFMQKVNVSDEQNGLKLTIDSVIVDETQMVEFLRLKNKITR